MPANKKYLSNTSQRIAKISAAIIGGYAATMVVHLIWGVFAPVKPVMVLSSAFTSFFMWIGFMLLAFSAKNGWMYWLKLLVFILIGSLIIYFFK